jgi:hypothetical protein
MNRRSDEPASREPTRAMDDELPPDLAGLGQQLVDDRRGSRRDIPRAACQPRLPVGWAAAVG